MQLYLLNAEVDESTSISTEFPIIILGLDLLYTRGFVLQRE